MAPPGDGAGAAAAAEAPPADASPADAACAELRALLTQAQAALTRSKVLSGRAAQLDATQRSLEQDLGFVREELTRLQAGAKAAAKAAGPAGAELVSPLDKALYAVHAVLIGSGPGGDLRGLMTPPKAGPFMELMLGAATRVQLSRPEARLRLKEDYYAFRDSTTPVHILAPLALLALRAHPPRASHLPPELPPGAASLVLPLGLQLYWCWLLWFYVSLALREHVLRVNGSSIRAWWIRHHYYSIALMLTVLTMRQGSAAAAAFTERYLLWSAAQGIVMLLQNSYQRKRTYTRIALGRASAMDVASGETSGTSGQLRLLFPALFALQAVQAANGLVVLRVAWEGLRAAAHARSGEHEEGPPLEWQALACGALCLVTALGSIASTATSLADKRRAGRREKQLRRAAAQKERAE